MNNARWQVAHVHQVYATPADGYACLCGAHPRTARGFTEHVLDEYQKQVDEAARGE